jgi:hypothetical protein
MELKGEGFLYSCTQNYMERLHAGTIIQHIRLLSLYVGIIHFIIRKSYITQTPKQIFVVPRHAVILEKLSHINAHKLKLIQIFIKLTQNIKIITYQMCAIESVVQIPANALPCSSHVRFTLHCIIYTAGRETSSLNASPGVHLSVLFT